MWIHCGHCILTTGNNDAQMDNILCARNIACLMYSSLTLKKMIAPKIFKDTWSQSQPKRIVPCVLGIRRIWCLPTRHLEKTITTQISPRLYKGTVLKPAQRPCVVGIHCGRHIQTGHLEKNDCSPDKDAWRSSQPTWIYETMQSRGWWQLLLHLSIFVNMIHGLCIQNLSAA